MKNGEKHTLKGQVIVEHRITCPSGGSVTILKRPDGEEDGICEHRQRNTMEPIDLNILEMPHGMIHSALKRGEITVCIIGLGHVGLPLALRFAGIGAKVIGVDIDPSCIEKVKNGRTSLIDVALKKTVGPLSLTVDGVEASGKAQVIFVCVPTPIDEKHQPDISAVSQASEAVGLGIRKGSIVMIESTVYIGATRNVILPILESTSGLRAGKDFGLAYVPERVDPGNQKHRLDNTPRVIGGIDDKSAEKAASILETIINAKIHRASSLEVAEATKLVENVYRDVNIAFVNELAKYFERIDVDIIETINLCSSKWSFHPHFPSSGVGGKCIPVSPYYLLHNADSPELKMVRLARRLNESMSEHMVKLVVKGLERVNKPIEKSKIAILGLTYKPEVADVRGSPARPIVEKLKEFCSQVYVHDPLLPIGKRIFGCVNSTFENAVRNADCLVIVHNHAIFKKIDVTKLKEMMNMPAAVVDGGHLFKPTSVVREGFSYGGVGRGGIRYGV